MRKIISISVFFVSTVVLSGCLGGVSKNDTTPQKEEAVTQESVSKKLVEKVAKNNVPQMLGEKKSVSGGDLQGSLKKLMASGKSLKCTCASTENGMDIVYTAYLGSKGDVRIEYVIDSAKNGKLKGAAIIFSNDQLMYSWMDNMNIGMKIDLNEMGKDAQPVSPEQAHTNLSALIENENINFDCVTWTFDPNMVALPQNVHFQDMSGLMKNAPQ